MDLSSETSEGSRVVLFDNQETTLDEVRARVDAILRERGQQSEKRDDLAIGGEDYVFGTTNGPSGSSLLFVSVDETGRREWALYVNQNRGALSRINPDLAVYVQSFGSVLHGSPSVDSVHSFMRSLRHGVARDPVLMRTLRPCFEVDPDGLGTTLDYMQELWDSFLASNSGGNASGESSAANPVNQQDDPDNPSPPSETNVTFLPVPSGVMDTVRDGLGIEADQRGQDLVSRGGHPILRGLLEAHCDTEFTFEDNPYAFDPRSDAHACTLVSDEHGLPFLIFASNSEVDPTWNSRLQLHYHDRVDLEEKPTTAIEQAQVFFHQLRTKMQDNSELNGMLAPVFARDDDGVSTSLIYGQSQASQDFLYGGRLVNPTPTFSLVTKEDFLDAIRTKRIQHHKLHYTRADPLLYSLLRVHLETSTSNGE